MGPSLAGHVLQVLVGERARETTIPDGGRRPLHHTRANVPRREDARNRRLEVKRGPGGLPPARCDPSQIEQVILSLVMNAIDAMPHGGTLSITSRKSFQAEEAQIQIQDDGIGIPAEILPNLFEPFFTTKERGHGLGLGLAISRTIVERHLGRIEVASEPGRGTIFTITLPINGKNDALRSAVRVTSQRME